MTHIFQNSWYGWIPTNLGELKFELIGTQEKVNMNSKRILKTNNKVVIHKLDFSHISDTFCNNDLSFPFLRLLYEEEEFYAKSDIEINLKKDNNSNNFYECSVSIFFNYSIYLSVNAIVEQNGKITIDFLSLSTLNRITLNRYEDCEEEFASIMYIILKSVIHGDNHHHQKIDTALIITKNLFDCEKIYNNMNRYIKTVEHDIKTINKCNGYQKIINSIHEMKGYYSYIESFKNLFSDNLKDKVLIDSAKVITSLDATVNKQKEKFSFRKDTFTIVLSFLVFAVSLCILLNSLLPSSSDYTVSFKNKLYVLFAGINFVLLFYVVTFKCMLLSFLFYNYYDSYEYLFHLSYLKKKKVKQRIKNYIIDNLFFIYLCSVATIFILIHFKK